jgi:hypothetical protein
MFHRDVQGNMALDHQHLFAKLASGIIECQVTLRFD